MAESIAEVRQQTEAAMQHAVEFFTNELKKIRAGKASPAILEGLTIDYYGSPTPINQVASVSAADARTLQIQPYESKHIDPIEKAILEANLGLNPSNDGTVIRAAVPQMTEERRKELVKRTGTIAEDARVGVRAARRDGNEALKKLQKDGESEDAIKAAEGEIQKMTDKFVAKIEDLFKTKESELMTV